MLWVIAFTFFCHAINDSIVLMSIIYTESEIGLGLTGFGVLFSFLGIIFFFDRGLLAMGNVSTLILSFCLLLICYIILIFLTLCCQILFLSGVMLTIGLKSTMQFFTKRKNYKVNLCYGLVNCALSDMYLFVA